LDLKRSTNEDEQNANKETGLTRIGLSRRGTFGECKRETELD